MSGGYRGDGTATRAEHGLAGLFRQLDPQACAVGPGREFREPLPWVAATQFPQVLAQQSSPRAEDQVQRDPLWQPLREHVHELVMDRLIRAREQFPRLGRKLVLRVGL